MRIHRETRRLLAAPALGVVLAAAIAACSSGPGSGSGPAASPSATVSTIASAAKTPGSSTGSDAAAAIKANWAKFFAGTTPDAQRVSLLQNGREFANTIGAMSAMGASASSKVSAVKLTSPNRATVTYTVYLGKTPALPDQKGVAVLENGSWKVSDISFCQLLALQNGGKVPSVCSSAS